MFAVKCACSGCWEQRLALIFYVPGKVRFFGEITQFRTYLKFPAQIIYGLNDQRSENNSNFRPDLAGSLPCHREPSPVLMTTKLKTTSFLTLFYKKGVFPLEQENSATPSKQTAPFLCNQKRQPHSCRFLLQYYLLFHLIGFFRSVSHLISAGGFSRISGFFRYLSSSLKHLPR